MTTNSRRKLLGSILVGFMVAFGVFGVTRVLDTDAAFVDDVFGNGTFDVSEFGIEGSTKFSEGYADHESAESALSILGFEGKAPTKFSPPVDVAPGDTTYAAFYLRTKAGSIPAEVTMSSAIDSQADTTSEDSSVAALWNTYMTYGARVLPAGIDPQLQCDSKVFEEDQGKVVVPLGSNMTYEVESPLVDPVGNEKINPFALDAGANGAAGAPRMVCFAFTLKPEVTNPAEPEEEGVKSGSPDSNGKSIFPMWEFAGVST